MKTPLWEVSPAFKFATLVGGFIMFTGYPGGGEAGN